MVCSRTLNSLVIKNDDAGDDDVDDSDDDDHHSDDADVRLHRVTPKKN